MSEQDYKVSGWTEGNLGVSGVSDFVRAREILRERGKTVVSAYRPAIVSRDSFVGSIISEQGPHTYFMDENGDEVGYYTASLHSLFVFGTPRKVDPKFAA